MNLQFVPVEVSDLDALFELNKSLIEQYEDLSLIDPDEVFAWVKRKLQRKRREYRAVILDGEKVGYFRLCDGEGDTLEIDDLYVLAPWQRRGIGTEIVRYCIEESERTEKPLMLYVFTHNTAAVRLYEKMGFELSQIVCSTRNILIRPLSTITVQKKECSPEPFNADFDKLAGQGENFLNYSLSLVPEAMAELDDDTLIEILRTRVLHTAQTEYDYDFQRAIASMAPAVRTAFILFCFDAEIQNGGLCQFFVNSTCKLAPHVVECLKLVGADDYAALFDEFCTENEINLNDLSSFAIEDPDEFETQNERYPFDYFDDDYETLYEKKPLEQYIARHARAHLNDF